MCQEKPDYSESAIQQEEMNCTQNCMSLQLDTAEQAIEPQDSEPASPPYSPV